MIKEEIAEWFLEQKYEVSEITAENKKWAYTAQTDAFEFQIGIDNDFPREIQLASQVDIRRYTKAFSSMRPKEQRDILFSLKFLLIDRDLAFCIPEGGLTEVKLSTYILEEEFSRKSLFEAVAEIGKGVQITEMMFDWKIRDLRDIGMAS